MHDFTVIFDIRLTLSSDYNKFCYFFMFLVLSFDALIEYYAKY